jgi:inositol transport system substrate-binding protein
MDATVFQDAIGQGAGALDAILELVKSGKQESGRKMIPFKLVPKENVTQFM